MNRETLVAKVDALRIPFNNAVDDFCTKLKTLISDVLVESNVNDIVEIRCQNTRYADIEVSGHIMTIYSDFSYKGTQKLRLNIGGTFGSFDASMSSNVNFYIVAGILAKNLLKMQEKFNTIDLTSYFNAYQAFFTAKHELEDFDCKTKIDERLKKEQAIADKLIVGTKLRVGRTWKQEPIVDEIMRVTNKLIFLKNNYGKHTRKTIAIENIMTSKWAFI